MNESETLLVEKLIDAPVERVWDAWADATKLAQWWRAGGIRETVITEYGFYPGGGWRQFAILDDIDIKVGESSPGSVFREIVPYEKIVLEPRPTEGEVVEVVPDIVRSVVRFDSLSETQTKVSLWLVRSKNDGWQPGEAQHAAYTEMLTNLANFVQEQ